MKVYIVNEMCFIDTKDGFWLCIGTKEEVDRSVRDQTFFELVKEATVLSQYRNVETQKHTVQ